MATYDEIATAFVLLNPTVPASPKTFSGRKRLSFKVIEFDRDQAALLSYEHFPVVVRDGERYLVNESTYYPSNHEREREGWQENPYHPRTKRMPSPTTRRQVEAVKSALRRAGFVEWEHNARSKDFDTPHGPETYQFSEWRRV